MNVEAPVFVPAQKLRSAIKKEPETPALTRPEPAETPIGVRMCRDLFTPVPAQMQAETPCPPPTPQVFFAQAPTQMNSAPWDTRTIQVNQHEHYPTNHSAPTYQYYPTNHSAPTNQCALQSNLINLAHLIAPTNRSALANQRGHNNIQQDQLIKAQMDAHMARLDEEKLHQERLRKMKLGRSSKKRQVPDNRHRRTGKGTKDQDRPRRKEDA